ncbi:MAG: hypothetical protein GY941_11980 [Planctomycetes bacterium]|nr:hypothetical protein [Planctomycetota bacterium]
MNWISSLFHQLKEYIIMVTPTIKPLAGLGIPIPIIYVTPAALAKINYYVDLCDAEVAWMGLVTRKNTKDNIYLTITDVYAPEQDVTATTADITADGIAKYVTELIEAGKDPQLLRYWGHSHVNMGVNESGTDLDTFREHSENLSEGDMFIMSIHNKKGMIRCHVYLGNGTFAENVEMCSPPIRGAKAAVKRELAANIFTPYVPTIHSTQRITPYGLNKTTGYNTHTKPITGTSSHSGSGGHRQPNSLPTGEDRNAASNAMGFRHGGGT